MVKLAMASIFTLLLLTVVGAAHAALPRRATGAGLAATLKPARRLQQDDTEDYCPNCPDADYMYSDTYISDGGEIDCDDPDYADNEFCAFDGVDCDDYDDSEYCADEGIDCDSDEYADSEYCADLLSALGAEEPDAPVSPIPPTPESSLPPTTVPSPAKSSPTPPPATPPPTAKPVGSPESSTKPAETPNAPEAGSGALAIATGAVVGIAVGVGAFLV